ncbi:hypothetical protein AJ80_05113 [Polytolypa hystricis UAMH7299]|uniref:Cytochrome P450 oxidoreductase GliF n=1 Tax=Polytolypa hystricis (strain UAMH7299) TaxID=1447883 RepID=A0A2B7Y799_POLH7|nr:hypothetical protein AJ80_05113 [Polytolypa hystricis UAMH7299]
MATKLISSAVEEYNLLLEQLQVMQGALAPLNLSKTQIAKLLAEQIWRDASSLGRAAVLAIPVIFILLPLYVYVIEPRFISLRRLGLPYHTMQPKGKGQGNYDYRTMLQEGAIKYPNQPYLTSYAGDEFVVFPSAFFDEVKRLPQSQASMSEYMNMKAFRGFRFLGTHGPSMIKTIGVDISRNITLKVNKRQGQARAACEAALGPAPEWKEVSIFWTMQDIIVRTVQTGLVGEQLGNDKRWLNTVNWFPMAIMVAIWSSNLVPRLVRPLVSSIVFLPALALHKYMAILLRPMVTGQVLKFKAATAESEEKRQELLRASAEKDLPITSWLMNRYRPEEREVKQVISDIIAMSFEATPSSAGTAYYILTELLVRPELMEELREELRDVMKDGKLPLTHLSELQKMDSVMRESARVNPISYLSLYRLLQVPLQLSAGPKLPKGSVICVDSYHIHNSPELWENPEVFDPLRFYKLRQQPGHKSRHQFSSLGSDAPGWGDGPQACPGRQFAGNTIKIVLAHLLLNYDIQLPPKQGKPKRHSMPNGTMQPDLSAKIMIREKRKS